MNNDIKITSWVSNKKKELNELKSSNRKKYIILASILSILNLATVILAIIAIVRLSEHSTGTKFTVIMASLSAGFIIILFVLNNMNIIYKGLMRDKYYKKGLDLIQHEIMKFQTKQTEYKSKKSEDLLVSNVEKIYNKSITKNNKMKMKLFLRAVTGGEHV